MNRPLHLIRPDCPLPAGAPVVCYLRDSGHEEQDRSIGQQRDGIEAYIAAHGLYLAHELFIDEAKRGSNTDKREALKAMRDFVAGERPRIGDRARREKKRVTQPYGVIFYESSRLGRDDLDTEDIRNDLALRAVTVIDLTTPSTGVPIADRIMQIMRAHHDALWLDDISKGAKRGLAQLVSLRDTDAEFLACNPGWQATGAYLGIHPGTVPRGFRGEKIAVGVNKRTGETRVVQRIVPDVGGQWERARLAWEMRQRGEGLKAIHRATGLYKTPAAYSTFFDNALYTGRHDYGGMVLEGFVPRLIPDEWFEDEQRRKAFRAQRLEGTALGEMEPRRVGASFLLSGLVACGCGEDEHTMHGNTTGVRKGRGWRHYQCNVAKTTRGRACDAKPISAAKLDAAVVDKLMARVLTEETLRGLASEMRAAMDETLATSYRELEALRGQQREVEAALERLADAVEAQGMSETLGGRLAKREAEKRALTARIRAAENVISRSAGTTVSEADVLAWGSAARAALLAGGAEAQQVVRECIARVVVTRDEVVIYFAFAMGGKHGEGEVLHTGKRPYPCIRLRRKGVRLLG